MRDTEERWNRPIGFTLNIAQEIINNGGSTGDYVARVSRTQAMTVPAVKRGRDLICGTLGTLRLKQLDSKRNTIDSELLDQPEADVARSVSMTRIVEDMFFEGKAWLRITEFGADGYPAKVVKLDARSVTVREQNRVYVSSDGTHQGQAPEYVPDSLLIRIDSPNDPLLVCGARAIRNAIALSRAASKYVDNPIPAGYFRPADGVTDVGDADEVEDILDDYEDSLARRAMPYLGAALKAEMLQWNPEQLQLSSMQDNIVLELSRLMGLDPEELGVSTTTRTYANAEQRRLDLVDFTLAAYVTAIEDRFSMPDVTQPGRKVRASYAGFLRSDTKSRMETYKVGREVGVYNDERIAELEDIPSARVPKPAEPPPIPPQNQGDPVNRPSDQDAGPRAVATHPGIAFSSATTDGLTVGFVLDSSAPQFKADSEKRTVTGLAVPWNVVASSGGYRWMFAPGSLHWSALGRVKLDRNHIDGTEVGVARLLDSGALGLMAKFGVARGAEGDAVLMSAEDGVLDGFSIYADFSSEGDGWTSHPDDDRVRLVHSATLRKVAITATPAFDDARLTGVAATREGTTAMTAPTAPAAPVPTSAPFDAVAFAAAFTEGMTESITAAVTAAITALPAPQVPERQTVAAGRGIVEVQEPPVYLMNGHGFSLVKDTWKARTEGDHEAAARLTKFAAQTKDASEKAMLAQFAVNTGNASQIVPPGYRPEMYVTQLMQGRPLVDSVSRGTLSDATPFNIPVYVSSDNETADHVEGVNPTAGTMVLGTKTVSPSAISGLFELTREIVDSANPAVDAIAMAAMQESYSQQTEARVYAKMNGADGVGGVITSGLVPSGAQASTTTGQGDELLDGVRAATAIYGFRRFAAPNRANISQEATSAFSSAKDTTGRPLLPYIGAQNAVGTSNPNAQGYQIDGLTYQPTWSMTGNAAGDADVFIFNSADVWAWESSLLMFRFEERNGPARIDLALFGYFATQVLRPVGLAGIRHTAA